MIYGIHTILFPQENPTLMMILRRLKSRARIDLPREESREAALIVTYQCCEREMR